MKETSRIFIIPLLARYTFTDTASRLQAGVLGGSSWLHPSYRAEYTYFNSSSQAVARTYQGIRNGAALTLGPQIYYELGSNFEDKLSLPFNLTLNEGGRFGDRLFLVISTSLMKQSPRNQLLS